MDVSAYLAIEPAPRVLFARVNEHPDVVRFMVERDGGGWREVTWGAFGAEVRSCALWLADVGVGAGDFCAVFADNSVQWLAAAFAIQTTGAAMVPVYSSSTTEQLAHVVGHSEAKVLFCGANKLARVTEALAQMPDVQRVVTLDGGGALAPPRELQIAQNPDFVGWEQVQQNGSAAHNAEPTRLARLLAAIDIDRPGVMLYTSGTSGQPKGVPLTHRNVGVNGRDWLVCNHTMVEPGDIDLLWLPFAHIFGFGEACLGNTLGFRSYLCSPLTVFEHLPVVRPHVFMSVPAYFDKIATLARSTAQTGIATAQTDPATAQADSEAAIGARLAAITGGRLRFCLSGGAGLKQEVKELFWRHGVLIIEGYGLTEASPTLTLNRPDAFRFDTVGKPLPSVELKLADDGEILARGDNVFAGYHKDAEATAAALTDDGWLRTGDIGRITEDGFVQIVDRKKDILVTAGGKNVPPANIEVRFADDPHIACLVVYGDGRKYLVAGVWLHPHVAADDATRAAVAARIDAENSALPRYMQIGRYAILTGAPSVENSLLTATLKIRRKRIYAAFAAELKAIYG